MSAALSRLNQCGSQKSVARCGAQPERHLLWDAPHCTAAVTSLTNIQNPVGHALSSRARRVRWFFGLTLASFALGSFRLGAKSLWLDEIASMNFALGGPGVWFADHNMSLYYALLAGVMKLFGRSEVALRSLSVLSFAGAASLVYALGARLCGERVGRSASVLFVLNAAVVHFAQEARGYLLALALVSASSLLLARLCERAAEPEPRLAQLWPLALGYGVVGGLSLYAHLFAVWVALAHALSAAWLCARGVVRVRLLLLGFAPLALSAVPLGLGVLERGVGQIAWLHPPSAAQIWAGLVLLSGGSVALALLELGLFGLFAFSSAPRADASTRTLLLAWCLVPPLVSYAFSWLVSPIVHPKYLLLSVPALLLGVAAAIDGLRSPRLRAALLGALLLLSCGRLYFWYAQYQRERWREAAQWLAARARPEDALVLDVMLAEPLDYYVERLELAARMPRLVVLARGSEGFDLRPPGVWSVPPPAVQPAAPELLRAALGAAPRVWWVQNRSATFDPGAWLGPTYRQRTALTLEPNDEDDRSLFADSRGRVITLRAFEPSGPAAPRESTSLGGSL
jgi:mannosyltransferase